LQPIQTTTTYWLVAVSVLTSVVASYAAFSFAERVATSKRGAYFFWLFSGALAMGLGIWSMHYLGMLSVRLPVEVVYHIPTVILSLMFAVLASVVVLFLVSRSQLTGTQLAAGSVLMGSGIGAMHYTGMHAMRSSLMHHYQPGLVALSVGVAVAFSWFALWMTFSMRKEQGGRELVRLGGAVLMGLGIAAMHYTAMTAVSFLPAGMSYSKTNTIEISAVGVLAVALTTGIILFGTLLTAVHDRKTYEQIAAQRDQLHAMAESSMDAIYLCESIRDAAGEIVDFRITYVNSNVEKVTSLPRSVLMGGSLRELMPSVRILGHLERYKHVVSSGEPLAMEFSTSGAQGGMAWVRLQAVKLRDGLAVTASDISARKQQEEQILHLAHHDPLTGLLNRSLLSDRLNQSIERARRNHSLVGVFLIDLDGFKQVNDTLGHDAGDQVLIDAANRLLTAVRTMDSVVRIGGDEFVVVTPDMKERAHIEICAQRVLRLFEAGTWIGDRWIEVQFSMGVAIYPESALSCSDLLAKADEAMYVAKRHGKNQFRIAAAIEQADQMESLPLGEAPSVGV
jgi:diguanylate cyclase (GGDEF)-like protein/PAS domain S-box-containing protein